MSKSTWIGMGLLAVAIGSVVPVMGGNDGAGAPSKLDLTRINVLTAEPSEVALHGRDSVQ